MHAVRWWGSRGGGPLHCVAKTVQDAAACKPPACIHHAPMPVSWHATPMVQTRFPANSEASGSASPLWHSHDVGPVHVVFLTSYAPYDEGTEQV